jgi:phosphotriesterase-related protein
MKKILPVLAFLIGACGGADDMVMTVTGPLDPALLGTTLPHEHFLVDFIGADSTGYHRWNKDTVIAKVLPFLEEAKASGVNTIIECTPAFLGRDPMLLKRLSQQSGINILTNTGFYGAFQNKALPEEAHTMTADEMAGIWISEWENGIEDSGIKPGFIKIAVPGDSVLSPVHEKLVRAAAKTHLATGLTINAHTGPDAPAMEEIKILKEEGVDPSALVWTHAQGGTPEGHIAAAKEGCWVSLDNVMTDNIHGYVQMLLNMKQNNLLSHVLISHDAGWYDAIDPSSVEYRGYTALFTHLKPVLISAGFTDDEWQLLTVTNPREAYIVRVRKRV